MININIPSTKNDVKNFLSRVHNILEKDENFVFIRNIFNEKEDYRFTNNYCISELEYDSNDVMKEILSLTEKEYYQSLFDNNSSGILYVFIKSIKNKQVYIKIKIKEKENGEVVLCISFHFAEHEVNNLPYNN